MSEKRPRIIGTTVEAVERSEEALGRRLPLSFRGWLLKNNGLYGVGSIRIFPVMDDRDRRKTWESIDREFASGWREWREIRKSDFSELLPFGEFGTGDYYCFDYSALDPLGEAAVVLWSHETGEIEPRAASFSEFLHRVESKSIQD